MSSSNSSDRTQKDDVQSFREIREYAKGRLDVDHHDLHPIAGLIKDAEVRHKLEFMAEEYDPSAHADLPADFWETKFARKAVMKYATDVATEAIEEGNLSQTAYFSGLPSYERDVSGIHVINKFTDWLINSEDCMLIYIAALMGRGKTDFSILIFELIWDHYRRLRRNVEDYSTVPQFAANFDVEAEGDAEVELINDYNTLRETFFTEGSSTDEKWYIFDEASSELTAQTGENAQKVVERMGSMIKKMRKSGVNLIVIGHDRNDVHVAIRSQAKYLDKPSKKQVKVYEGIKSREPVNHQMTLDGVPPTSWGYDTDDSAEWDWGDGIEEGDPRMDPEEVKQATKEHLEMTAAIEYYRRKGTEEQLTQSEIAEMFSGGGIEIRRGRIPELKPEIDMRALDDPSGTNPGRGVADD